jgi:hypothetical protein
MRTARTGLAAAMLAFSLFPCRIWAVDNHHPGARAKSLSSSVVALPGIEGLFHNQAGLSFIERASLYLACESGFLLKELSLMAAGVAFSTGHGTFSTSYYRFGSDVYNSCKMGAAYSRKFGKSVSGGFQFDLISEKYPENKSPFIAWVAEFGVMAGNPQKFLAGFHFFNPMMARMKTAWGVESLPRSVRAGYSWIPGEGIVLCSEVEKTNRSKLLYKTGIEFTPDPVLSFRAGVCSRPLKFTGGIGFRHGKVNFDIGFSYHGNLGYSPLAGITITP